MAVITFSINASQVKALQELRRQEESDNLVAKRLLLSVLNLDDLSKSMYIDSDIEQRLEAIEQRLDASSNTAINPAMDNGIEQRLGALEQTLEQVSNTSNNAGSVTGIEQRLETLEQTLEHLSTTWSEQIRLLASDSPPNLVAVEERLEILEQTLDEISNYQKNLIDVKHLQPLEERLEAVEQVSNTSNNAGSVTGIEQRLEALEQRSDSPSTLKELERLSDKLSETEFDLYRLRETLDLAPNSYETPITLQVGNLWDVVEKLSKEIVATKITYGLDKAGLLKPPEDDSPKRKPGRPPKTSP